MFRYSDETAEAVTSGEKLLKESGTIYESFADMMSPEDAKRYLDFLENGSREGLTGAELAGVEKADALLVSQKVGYEDVWDLRNVGDALETSYGKSSGKYDTTADFLTNIESGSDSVKNWKGQEVKVPDGHIMSPRDPSFSAKPITEAGPYTLAQRDAFLAGNSAGTKLAPHHRHQIPVRDGGVIDELPGPGHPSGNQHTAGSPSRHPAKSIFNSERSGNVLRANEITQHWIDKGNRLIEVEPGVWIDPGF